MEFLQFLAVVAICCAIAVSVWALFLLGAFLGVQWYVSAVAIILIGEFLLSFLSD